MLVGAAPFGIPMAAICHNVIGADIFGRVDESRELCSGGWRVRRCCKIVSTLHCA